MDQSTVEALRSSPFFEGLSEEDLERIAETGEPVTGRVIDASRVRRDLGWAPREDFSSGLRRTVQWYLDNERWVSRVTSGAYRGERLGLVSGA